LLVNRRHETLITGQKFVRPKSKQPILFFRPKDLANSDVPFPASDMSNALCFVQSRFAELEGILGLLAPCDVSQNSGVKLSLVGFPARKSQLDRKFRAVFSSTLEFHPFANTTRFPGRFQAGYRIAVSAMVPLRNNGGERFAKRLSFIVAENCRCARIPKNHIRNIIARGNGLRHTES